MEADWEVEIGPDEDGIEAPVIDGCWPGCVDLRSKPGDSKDNALMRAGQLAEVKSLPALATVLVAFNAAQSTVRTVKCDVWVVEGDIDPYELDAPLGTASHALGCYIDLLPVNPAAWATPELAVESCKKICARLSAVALSSCRIDLVVRHAILAEGSGLGITAYATACGPSNAAAQATMEQALREFAHAVVSGWLTD